MIYFAYGSNMDATQMQFRCPGEFGDRRGEVLPLWVVFYTLVSLMEQ